jgi:hypothetical protein
VEQHKDEIICKDTFIKVINRSEKTECPSDSTISVAQTSSLGEVVYGVTCKCNH